MRNCKMRQYEQKLSPYLQVDNMPFQKQNACPWGGSSFSTQIKNYPVQGFATADIVPLACIGIQELLEET